MTRPAFEPRGAKSIRAACEEIIRGLPEKDGISYDVAVTEVQALTGLDDLEREDLMGPMLLASESLLTDGVLGVLNIANTGWQRMTPEDAVKHAENRQRRGRKQFRRMGRAARAADPERLSWDMRHRRDVLSSAERRIAELQQRRSKRLRPLPPGKPEDEAG